MLRRPEKDRPSSDVLFVNAEREVATGRNQNRLEPRHIEKIIRVCERRETVPGFSRLVSWEEIAHNSYNLNIRGYVETVGEEDYGDPLNRLWERGSAADRRFQDRFGRLGPGLGLDLPPDPAPGPLSERLCRILVPMAIIYKATITPTKPALIGAWLDGQPWAGQGPDEALGAYRFDDPAGEVGVEVFLIRRGGRLLHVPLTYRGAPLPGHEDHLVGTMEHSVLGTRWVYDGTEDEVAVACFRRALTGEQEQADLEIWEDGRVQERRPQQILVSREPGAGDDATGSVRDGQVLIPRVLDGEPGGRARLHARWGDEQRVVAALT